MNKKTKKMLKFSLFVGILLGVGLKVFDFIKVRAFRCGIQKAVACSWLAFIKDTIIWAILTTVIVFVIVFGIKYLVKYGFTSIKKIRLPKKEKKKENKKEDKKQAKKEKKEEKEEEPKEESEDEVIKI